MIARFMSISSSDPITEWYRFQRSIMGLSHSSAINKCFKNYSSRLFLSMSRLSASGRLIIGCIDRGNRSGGVGLLKISMTTIKKSDLKRNLVSLWQQFLPLSLSDVSIAASIARLHGGSLKVEIRLDLGSR
jgi:hypothetical protein